MFIIVFDHKLYIHCVLFIWTRTHRFSSCPLHIELTHAYMHLLTHAPTQGRAWRAPEGRLPMESESTLRVWRSGLAW